MDYTDPKTKASKHIKLTFTRMSVSVHVTNCVFYFLHVNENTNNIFVVKRSHYARSKRPYALRRLKLKQYAVCK